MILRTVGDVLTRNSSNLAKKFAETRFFNYYYYTIYIYNLNMLYNINILLCVS